MIRLLYANKVIS